ncbi:MAG: YceI family protein [Rhodospirillales bacterium]|nr:YceI family protein [Alphaproteobacteria bacterium]MCB9986430.1 YceI family protein [Rhodospirillales bacterium]USO07024.1 MAG: YceI family protein [Rhodospirillales bacterium]
MQMRNTADKYGAVARILHWLIAALVVAMLLMGVVMEDLSGPTKFEVMSLHKATGITILALMLVRLGWRLINHGMPMQNPAHAKWERMLSTAVHWALYVLLIAMPLSGWILVDAANSTINWYGFFPLPHIVGPDKELRHLMAETHETIATLIWITLGLHVAGALKHHFIDKDATMRRMLPAFILGLMLLGGTAHAADTPYTWAIDHGKSHLTFEATQEGSAFTGTFTAFDGTIVFDPTHPESGRAQIAIDLNSADSENDERDSTLKGRDWFDTTTAPTASYKIEKFIKGDKDGDYTAVGQLVLRGVEKPVSLPFHLTMQEKDGGIYGRFVGETQINRLNFGVGDGQWADPKMVGDTVTVRIDLSATTQKPK